MALKLTLNLLYIVKEIRDMKYAGKGITRNHWTFIEI